MSQAEFSALLRRFCVAVLGAITHRDYWRTICDVADAHAALGQKAIDELLAVDPSLPTIGWEGAEPTLKNLAAGYVEPTEGDPLSPPVGLSTDALGRLMIAHDRLLSGSRLHVGALVQAGSPAPPSVVELSSRLTSAQWNAEGEQARKVIEAVLALNGSPLGSSTASAPREEILAEVNLPAGASVLDAAAELIASGKLLDVLGNPRTVRLPEPAPSPPPDAPSSDLLRAVDALRVGFTVQIVEDPDIEGNWLVNLHPRAPGPTLGFSAALLGQALLKAVDGGRQLLEQQSQRITRALDAIRGAQ